MMGEVQAAITAANGCIPMCNKAGIMEGAACADVVPNNVIFSQLIKAVPNVVFKGRVSCTCEGIVACRNQAAEFPLVDSGMICRGASSPSGGPPNYISQEQTGPGEGEYKVSAADLDDCQQQCARASTWGCKYISWADQHKQCYLHQDCTHQDTDPYVPYRVQSIYRAYHAPGAPTDAPTRAPTAPTPAPTTPGPTTPGPTPAPTTPGPTTPAPTTPAPTAAPTTPAPTPAPTEAPRYVIVDNAGGCSADGYTEVTDSAECVQAAEATGWNKACVQQRSSMCPYAAHAIPGEIGCVYIAAEARIDCTNQDTSGSCVICANTIYPGRPDLLFHNFGRAASCGSTGQTKHFVCK